MTSRLHPQDTDYNVIFIYHFGQEIDAFRTDIGVVDIKRGGVCPISEIQIDIVISVIICFVTD